MSNKEIEKPNSFGLPNFRDQLNSKYLRETVTKIYFCSMILGETNITGVVEYEDREGKMKILNFEFLFLCFSVLERLILSNEKILLLNEKNAQSSYLMSFNQSFTASHIIAKFFACNQAHHRVDPCHQVTIVAQESLLK